MGIVEDAIIILAASLASFWRLLGDPNVIMHLDLLFPTDLDQYLQLSLQSWNPLVNLGLTNFNADASLPLAWTYYLLSKIGLTPGQIERLLLIGVIFLAGMSMYLLSMYLSGGKRLVGLISAIVYMFNPFVVDNMLWGQVYLQAAYSLIPLVLLCFIVALDRFSPLFAGFTGVLLALVSCLQIQFGYIAVMILALWIMKTFYRAIITRRNLHNAVCGIARSTFILLVAGSVAAVSRLYLVLQVLFGELVIERIPFQQTGFWYQTVVRISESIGGVQNTIRLRYRVYSFYQVFENQALQTWHIPCELLLAATSLFVILVFASVPLRKRSRSVAWFAIVVLLFAYLAAGTSTPINVYRWLLRYAYGFFIFREPSKFLVGVALGSSYLLGVTMSRIYEFLSEIRLPLQYEMKLKHGEIKVRPAKLLVVLILFVVLWPNVFPVTQGNFGGLHSVTFPKGYEDTYNWLKSKPGDFRVLILPLSTMGNWSFPALTPWTEGYAGIPFYNSPPKPIIIQPSAIAMSQGSQRILYYLENLMYTGQVDRLASLLLVLNVKYVVVGPMDEASPFDSFRQPPSQALKLMQRTPSLTLVYSSGGFHIFENLEFRGQMYMTNASFLAFGNLDLLGAPAMGSQAELPALVYGYNLKSDTLSSIAALSKGIILQGDRFLDYVIQSIDDRYSFTLTPYVPHDENDPTKSWVLATVYPRPVSDVYASGEFYSPAGFVYTKGANISLVSQCQNREDGEQLIWIRAVQGPDAGMLQIVAGSNEFPIMSLHSQLFQGFRWRLVGSARLGTGTQKLSIKNLNGTNLVDRLVIVPTEIFNASYAKCCNSLRDRGFTFVVDPASFTEISGYGPAVNQPKKLEYLGFVEAVMSQENDSLVVTITNTHNTIITYGFNLYVNGHNRFTEFSLGPPLAPGQSFTRYYDRETLGNAFPNTGDLVQIEPIWVVRTTNEYPWTVKETFPRSSIYKFGEKPSGQPVASLPLIIPYSSRFDLLVDAQATAGTVGLNVMVGNRSFSTRISASPKGSNGAIKLGSIRLDKGVHWISVEADEASKGDLEFFNLKLVASSWKSSHNQIAVLQPKFDSFTHATIHTNNSPPVFLVYSGSYDEGWILQTKEGHVALHVETNGFANGWFLPEAKSNAEEQMLDLSFHPQGLLDASVLAYSMIVATIVGASVFVLAQCMNLKEKIARIRKRFVKVAES